MNITPSTVYWVAKMDSMRCTSFGLTTIALIVFLAMLIVGLTAATKVKDYGESEQSVREINEVGKRILRKLYVPGIVFLVMILVGTFIPTTKQFAAMYVIPAVANNEKVQTVGNRLYDLAIEWMDELKPAKKEEN